MSRRLTTPAPDWAGLDLDAMTPVQARIAWAMYGLGYMHGLDRGREQADTEAAEVWSDVARRVRAIANQPTFEELCRRRGEPERLERQRQHLLERGVA